MPRKIIRKSTRRTRKGQKGGQSTSGVVTTLAGSGRGAFADGTGSNASFWSPYGIAIDKSGNSYVADLSNCRIRKITPDGVVSTFAGSGSYGSVDGTGTDASFNGPTALAIDANNNLIVTEFNSIRKITPDGVVTTIAGSLTSGFADGTGLNAAFNRPTGVVIDANNNIYVADFNNYAIRKVTLGGMVTTIAGGYGGKGGRRGPGFADGTGSSAGFSYPSGVAVDASGNVIVADTHNNLIRKITPEGVVTTIAGNRMNVRIDGTGTAAGFNNPLSVAVDARGNIIIAEEGCLRKITPEGVVSTIAGSGVRGFSDGTGSSALFTNPRGIAIDANSNIYVADTSNGRIRKITGGVGSPTSMALTTTMPLPTTIGRAPITTTPFTLPTLQALTRPAITAMPLPTTTGRALTTGSSTTTLPSPHVILNVGGPPWGQYTIKQSLIPSVLSFNQTFKAGDISITTSNSGSWRPDIAYFLGNIVLLRGSYYINLSWPDARGPAYSGSYGASPHSDLNAWMLIKLATTTGRDNITGPTTTTGRATTSMSLPTTTALATSNLSMIRAGVTTLAGGTQGYMNGIGTAARFSEPCGVVTDTTGNVYVADGANHCIRKIDSKGNVTIFAGTAGRSGLADGVGTSAKFWNPRSLAINSKNNIYVADNGNHAIRLLQPNGVVVTIAGGKGMGYADGNGPAAKFSSPHGIFIDNTNNIYIADTGNHRIRKMDMGNNVTTIAGSSVRGSTDGRGMSASFNSPYALTIDSANNIMYVADWDSARVRKITMLPTPIVTTLAGNGNKRYKDGIGAAASLQPASLALGANNMLYVADANNNRLRAINTRTGNVITIGGNGTAGNVDSADPLKATFNNPRGIWIDQNNIIYVTQFSGPDCSIRTINVRSMPLAGGGKRKRRSMRKTRRRGRR